MAELNMDFDPAEIPADDRSFELLPAGEYTMQVIDSEIKDTKSGTGQQLVLTLEVIDGPHSNRRVWDRLNIRNQNPDAQRIAQRALADLCLAVGVQSLRNSEDLHFKPFIGKIGVREDRAGKYGPQNTVRYKVRGGAAPRNTTVKESMQAATANPSSARQTFNGGAPSNAQKVGAKPWQKVSA